MHEIVGRDAELAAGERFLARAGERLDILVLDGEAGIGKTTLWAAIRGRALADGRRVLTARATASESTLTLAALADVLDPVGEDVLATLPGPQRRAIETALLRGSLPPGDALGSDTRLLATAVRSLLDRLASEQPVVLALDDAQWVDPASAAVLGYAIRRLAGRPIGVLAARRRGEEGGLDPGSLAEAEAVTRLEVGPVSVAVLHHLLARHLGRTVPRSTLVRIHAASAGVPLFALEIARLLDEVGLPPVGQPLPVPHDVRELVRRRVMRLPARSLEVLLAAAVDGHATVAAVASAVGRPVDRDLAVAARLDVATLEHDRIAFVHPLFAAAVLSVAGDDARRTAHARMAQVALTAESRARHRALAAVGPDPQVADDLESAAREAARRGSPATAAELLDLALASTPPDAGARRNRLTLELAAALQRSGDAGRARALLGPLAATPGDPLLRARARIALATILFETDVAGSQLELCEAAIADAAGDPEVAAHAHAMAAAISWDDFRRRDEHVRAAVTLLAPVPDPDPAVLGLVLLVQCENDVSSGRPLDPDVVARGLALEERAALPNVSDRFSAALGTWLKYTDDFDGARHWLDRTLQAAIDEGDEGSLPYALSHLPELELWTGRWAAAEAAARRHLAHAESTGLEAQRRQAVYNLGLVLVHRGDEAAARALIDPVLAAASADGDAWIEASLRSLLGQLELSLGRAEAAAGQLGRAATLRDATGQVSPRRWDADLVESLVVAGDAERAQAELVRAEARARASGRHSALANVARARATVLGAARDLGAAIAALEAALEEHARASIPFDRARTLMVLGQIRRRRGERTAAKAALDEAVAAFEGLGAARWAERASEARERLGIRRAATGLTDGERRVAQLAATGLTNREVAARLFVSPKTVEANLARAYAKLGVGSRAELGALVARSPEILAGEPGG